MANDRHHLMRVKVFPIRGRCCPHPGACMPVPPGTWRPTVWWGHQGGGAGQRSQGWGRERGFCSAAVAAIVPGEIRQCHRRPDAESHRPGPVPVGGMARQPQAPRGCDKDCRRRPTAAGPLSRSRPGGASLWAMAWSWGAHFTLTALRSRTNTTSWVTIEKKVPADFLQDFLWTSQILLASPNKVGVE
jgi:hypothetical protein